MPPSAPATADLHIPALPRSSATAYAPLIRSTAQLHHSRDPVHVRCQGGIQINRYCPHIQSFITSLKQRSMNTKWSTVGWRRTAPGSVCVGEAPGVAHEAGEPAEDEAHVVHVEHLRQCAQKRRNSGKQLQTRLQ